MVVDDQHLATVLGQFTQCAESVDTRNIHCDNQIRVIPDRAGRDHQMPARQGLQRLGQLVGSREGYLDLLARVVEHLRERQPGADGVGIGIDVAHDADARRAR